jgi:hypothetical protein
MIGSLFLLMWLSNGFEADQGYRPLTAALHVHSRFSNGNHEIFELASYAHQRKLDVLGLTDSFLTRARYGVGPLKKLFSRSVSRQSVSDRGVADYLDSVGRAQQQFDDVVILPGLEVTPHYYWQGTFPRDLRLYDFDRHLLVFGLVDGPTIANLPVIENATWSNVERDWMKAAGPLLLLAFGILGAAALRRSRGGLCAGSVVVMAGIAWLYDAYPFGRLPDAYSGKQDNSAFQRLIDYVNANGGLTFWSYPEARYPDVQMAGARMISRGTPEVLGLTEGYAGFEGLYGDRITITEPGNLWDQILMDYLAGGRKTWPSATAGIDFHDFKKDKGWYELNQGLSILWAKEKNRDAILDALRLGRGYATFQESADRNLRMVNFGLSAGGHVAIAGETLKTASPITVTVTIDADGGPPSARIEVVRNGDLLERADASLPWTLNRTDSLPAGRHYYRVRVKHGRSELLSNPIFCTVG